jgi:hypothetical protein
MTLELLLQTDVPASPDLRDPATERPDYCGECDSCHNSGPLWVDWREPGEFALCSRCWARAAKAVRNARRTSSK